MNCVALFRAIPIQSTSPMSALNIPTLLVCVFPPPASKSLIIFGRVQCFRIVWDTTYFGRHRANWYAVAAIAVLFAYSPAMAVMPAAIATTRRKKTIKSAVNASPPLNCASHNSVAFQTSTSHSHPNPNGSITEPFTKPVSNSISSKLQSKHIASRNRSAHNCSPITSARYRPLLGEVGADPAQTRFSSGWCLSLNLGGLLVGYFDCDARRCSIS